ncbi:MAG TPA: M1 family aminopeptidase [Thermoanaerobaculia bacterium]|nr:M1 family aminopeptidase [Thermoanaerobaculia bacterium]
MRRLAALLIVVAAFALPLLAAVDPKIDYEQSQRWQFAQAVNLPAGGVTITRDTATWTLQSGTVRHMQPLADGTVTGIVFEGQGRFVMNIPDRFELAQLRRFARDKKDQMTALDQPITQFVLRTTDRAILDLFPPAPPSPAYTRNAIAEKRHETWLVELFDDVDSRILAALINNTPRLVIDMRTADFDWLRYDYDGTSVEEISVTKFAPVMPEVWVSLDRPEDRRADGRPGARPSALAALQHIDVKVDLTKYGSSGEIGDSQQRSLDGQYVVTSTFVGLAPSVSALEVDLDNTARELKAFSANGTELVILRDHIGKRALKIDGRIYDGSMVVLLDTPLKQGEKRQIRFEYKYETANYAPGGMWYPTIAEGHEQKHTARLELTVNKKNELRSMGRMDSRTEADKTETSVWIVDRPSKMITFSTATRFQEQKIDVEGVPSVVAFGPQFYGGGNATKVRNVGADVSNSLQFFQNLLGDKLPGETFYVTNIAGGHGQAFDGFLHMSEYTFTAEHPGASELFRAHEVAHEWFGHKVGWQSYRDQWLSEALAEYAAMMFVQSTVKGGKGFFEEILRSYDGIVKGNLSGGFSKFNRPGLIEFSAAERNRVGPIGHGWRASTTEIPTGYVIQTYYRAPLVLHMLRALLLYRTQSDDMFIKIMRDWVRDYGGKAASTADFQRVLQQNVGGDWSWFFDSWIYSSDIPTIRWRHEVQEADGVYNVTVHVERTGVADDFRAIIPIRVDFDGGTAAYFYMSNKQPKQSVTQKVAKRPKGVVLAPDYSLLANIRRD